MAVLFGSPLLSACGLDAQGTEFSGASSGAGGAGGAGSVTGGGVGGAAGGGGGQGGGGGFLLECTPGDVVPCYTGPAGTLNMGACKGGMKTCNAAGNGFGPCLGETTPKAENCGTLADEDCDGAMSCLCSPTWENVFGAAGNDNIGDIATDGAGNVYIAARFNGQVALAKGGAHTSNGKVDVLVAKIASDGMVLWSKSFGGGENDRPFAIAVTATGDVVVGGLFEGIVSFGGSNVNAGPAGAAFLLRLNGDGSFANVALLDGNMSEYLLDVAVDAAGNAYAVGLFSGTFSAGGKSLTPVAGAGTEGFVAKVTPAAVVSWLSGVMGPGEQRVNGVAVDGSGNVYIAGAFENTIEIGAGVLVSQGDRDALLAQLAGDTGIAKWSKGFGPAGPQEAVRVEIAVTDVVVGGNFDGSITVGATTLSENGNGNDIFVARLLASGVTPPVWMKKFGSTADDRLEGMAIELNTNVLLSGSYSGPIAFGGPSLPTKGGPDAFFARLSAALGGHVCSRGFGGSGAQVGRAVAAGVGGAAFLAGEFGGTVDFGFGAHSTPNVSDLDAFLLKLNP